MKNTIPLLKRPIDIPIVIFFWINILFITYMVDFEQITVADPSNFDYPLWPPPFMVDLVHWWGNTFDPVLMARPPWWMVTIWIDAVFFGPFYVVAIYAYTKGKEWIRIPSIIYASVLLTNVLVILGEELFGAHATPNAPIVLMANAPWLLMPIYIIYRMWRHPRPFSKADDRGDNEK
jgi:hypothetical protein